MSCLEERGERRQQRAAYRRQYMTLERQAHKRGTARHQKAAAARVLIQSEVTDTAHLEHSSLVDPLAHISTEALILKDSQLYPRSADTECLEKKDVFCFEMNTVFVELQIYIGIVINGNYFEK